MTDCGLNILAVLVAILWGVSNFATYSMGASDGYYKGRYNQGRYMDCVLDKEASKQLCLDLYIKDK